MTSIRHLLYDKSMQTFLWQELLATFKVHINSRIPRQFQRRMAERRVIREIQRAYKNVPYYHQKYDQAGIDISSIRSLEDLKKLPFITKDEIRNNFPEGLVARGINIDKCQHSSTSGSSGKPLSFIFSPSTYAFYLAVNRRIYDDRPGAKLRGQVCDLLPRAGNHERIPLQMPL